MRRIFVSHSLNDRDLELAEQVEVLLRSHGMVATTGRNLGGGAVTPEVAKRISESDGLIALLTQRTSEDTPDPRASHPWVRAEFAHARLTAGVAAVGVYETDVIVDASDQGYERVNYDPADPLKAFLRLSELVGEWKRQAGRLFKVQVLPDDIAKQLGKKADALRFEYRVQRENKDTEWAPAKVRREVAGLFAYVRVPEDAEMVQVRTHGEVACESDYTPLWMPIRLQEV